MRNQYIHLASALAIAGLVASQIPSRSSISLAADGCCAKTGVGCTTTPPPSNSDAEQLAMRAGGLVLLAGFANAGAGGVGSGPGGVLLAGEQDIASLLRTQARPLGISDFSAIYANSGQQTVSEEKDLGLAGLPPRNIGTAEAQGTRTVFAPTNESLSAALGAERVAQLKLPANQSQARAFVESLTLQGQHNISQIKNRAARRQSLLILNGDSLVPNIGWGELMLSEHPATDGIVIVTNGVFNQN